MILFLLDLIKKQKRTKVFVPYELIFLDVPFLVFILFQVL